MYPFSLLNLSAVVSHGGAGLHFMYVQKGKGKRRDWRDITERTRVSGENHVQSGAETNTNRHPYTWCLQFLANLWLMYI